jgi:hypothetical protein
VAEIRRLDRFGAMVPRGVHLTLAHQPDVLSEAGRALLATLCAIALSAVTVFAGEYPDISIAELKKAIAEKKKVSVARN